MKNATIKKIKIFPLITGLCLFMAMALPASLAALDWGVLLDQSVGQEGTNGKLDSFAYNARIIPWLSSPLGGNADLYFSAGGTVKSAGWMPVPELHQADILFNFNAGEFRAGRMHYSDTLGIIASGLFDGLALSFDTAASGSFSGGAWYTGGSYKKTAYITMTQEDLNSYNAGVDYKDFVGTYFSSSRLLAAFDWEHPAIAELVRLKASLIGQFDLNGRGKDKLLHSQYLSVSASLPVTDSFSLDAGGAFNLIEKGGAFQFGMLGEASLSIFFPAEFLNRLKVSGIFSSGGTSGAVSAFIPVTTEPLGDVLQAKVSGLSLIGLDYLARLNRAVSVGVSNTYFILSDQGSYSGFPDNRNGGFFLGDELYGRLIWSPVSDLRLNLGAGAFFPMLGNVDPGAGVRWKAELSAQLAIF
jgi:hypothetical protein